MLVCHSGGLILVCLFPYVMLSIFQEQFVKKSIHLLIVVSSLLLCVSQAQAEAEACHEDGQEVVLGSIGGGRYGEMDANGDGMVSKSEFDDYHSRQFNEMDGNKDGKLTLDEMNAGPKMPMGNSATAHLDRRFNAADSNHDGGLDRTESGAMPMLSMYFDEVDANKDGKVTRQEYFDAMPLLHRVKRDKANML
jgi:hypothetical protein